MSKNQHTPGPWTWGKDNCGLYGSGDDNEVLTYERHEGMWLSYGDSQEANGRLIAAAPTMYSYIKQRSEQGDVEATAIMGAIYADT